MHNVGSITDVRGARLRLEQQNVDFHNVIYYTRYIRSVLRFFVAAGPEV